MSRWNEDALDHHRVAALRASLGQSAMPLHALGPTVSRLPSRRDSTAKRCHLHLRRNRHRFRVQATGTIHRRTLNIELLWACHPLLTKTSVRLPSFYQRWSLYHVVLHENHRVAAFPAWTFGLKIRMRGSLRIETSDQRVPLDHPLLV